MAWVNKELDSVNQKVSEAMSTEGGESDADAEIIRLVAFMYDTCKWTPEMLAENTRRPANEVAAMLDHLSVDFACQPDFRTPFDDNRARCRPLIRLPRGEYLAAFPWSVARVINQRLQRIHPCKPCIQTGQQIPEASQSCS